MIHEEDLREAIAECEGSRNPTSGTCLKLAAYYAILDHKFGKPEDQPEQATRSNYSFSADQSIPYGQSEFSQIIQEKGIVRCFPVLEETAQALSVIVPKLYNGMIRKLEDI